MKLKGYAISGVNAFRAYFDAGDLLAAIDNGATFLLWLNDALALEVCAEALARVKCAYDAYYERDGEAELRRLMELLFELAERRPTPEDEAAIAGYLRSRAGIVLPECAPPDARVKARYPDIALTAVDEYTGFLGVTLSGAFVNGSAIDIPEPKKRVVTPLIYRARYALLLEDGTVEHNFPEVETPKTGVKDMRIDEGRLVFDA